ncbi:ATPase involved in chromosome partitioning-like protein [Halorubrum coriense DSM 10284]|uniref:ATPase involved in chromosome partitioning-like protein n=1 Tax=Halorubrum coriense DSM 10284 TaxID=1227466 RepID=M0E8Z3_9EURY|nr:ParA family protein [Halorubrum coriense]ELZ43362.1 ATPase involved in chromosome partitioning-like protein [Halorubrum coriense DSM 10284]
MLTYTTYSEAGGVGKTTLASNLADAHAQRGRDVLLLDLDPQNGSITYLLGIDAARDDGDQDNIARHLIDRPKGAFEDLIHETPFGFDLVPSHNMLEDLADLLGRAESMAEDLGEEFDRFDRLRQVLLNAGVPDKYDTVIVDPPATAGPHLYNAIGATRSLVVPLEPTGKGMQSIKGLQDVVDNFEATVGVDVGVLAVVPNGVGRTADQQEYLERIRELGYHAPVAIGERSSLFEGCWDKQTTAFAYVDEHRSRKRDHEMDTLDQLRELAAHVEEVA